MRLLDVVWGAAKHGDLSIVGEIIVYGDKALRDGCADPDLIACLVRVARTREEEIRRDQAEWAASG